MELLANGEHARNGGSEPQPWGFRFPAKSSFQKDDLVPTSSFLLMLFVYERVREREQVSMGGGW